MSEANRFAERDRHYNPTKGADDVNKYPNCVATWDALWDESLHRSADGEYFVGKKSYTKINKDEAASWLKARTCRLPIELLKRRMGNE